MADEEGFSETSFLRCIACGKLFQVGEKELDDVLADGLCPDCYRAEYADEIEKIED